MKKLLVALVILVAAVAILAAIVARNLPQADLPPAQPQPVLDPIAFFEGTTSGIGTIHIVTGDTKTLTVTSSGEKLPSGALRLTQQIAEGDKNRTRVWTITPLDDGRYTGSLTDAAGPVAAVVAGNRMTIRYDDDDGNRITQILALADENTIRNRMTVRRFGIPLARVDETISKP